MDKILWYKEPADSFNRALPLGNGYMGAMCFGGSLVDRFLINNDSVWWGGKRDRINPSARENIPKVRELIRNGHIQAAEDLANEALAGVPDYQSHYEPLMDAFIIPDGEEHINLFGLSGYWSEQLTRDEKIADYRRQLDIEEGIHTLEYTKEGKKIIRESFISYPDKVMAVSCKGFSGRLVLERGNQCEKMYALSENTFCLLGTTGASGVRFCALARVIAHEVSIIGRTLHFSDDAIILITSQTDFYSQDYVNDALAVLDKAESKGYDRLRTDHVADVQALMRECVLELESEDYSYLPTDQRLQAISDIPERASQDLGMINLAFNYGRYLLISCSRPGSLPANLQGIWNDSYTPAWDSKFTININTEMNYWCAESTGLSQLHQPLFDHIKRMQANGRRVAEEMYGARGFMAHHNTDIWGDCAPQDIWPSASYWQMGAAWLCLHILEHYRYTKDDDFIEEYLPIVKEAALFFEDSLIENTEGQLIVSPTSSPENVYRLPNGDGGSLCEGASMDAQILYELFSGMIETGKLEKAEEDRYRAILDRLPRPTIAENGTIMEWAKEYEEMEIGHRHISHLFALYPGKWFFEAENKDELLIAARKTLERRLAAGGGHTGWSRAWIINLWARLGDGEKCMENIRALLAHSMLPNMFDNHPPFQIDGNFGLVSGIVEMLMHSHTQETIYLPALPASWKNGKISGLRTRHGEIVDLTWMDSILITISPHLSEE